ncbi:P63C domain-containing protein [Psychrobacter vallis]|uniref:P63C domain-containing protein n=1 Tax=Psychrobacter vallis TaxID=248451 RepID=UPI001D10977D|nr:P63C domain-containing protein [Psychrobacter vallis]
MVYKKLAPEILPELKKQANKTGKKSARLHQTLTSDVGHPKLREHLASIVTLMKVSEDKDSFFEKVNLNHPDFNENYHIDFDE